MARTTPQKVRDILECVDSDAVLSAFIDPANILTDSVYDCDQANKKQLSANQLTIIETWLAACFYHIRDLRVKESQTGKSKDIFQGETGMYLDSNQYGQMAIIMDTSGCLAKMNKEAKQGGKNKISVHWLGTSQSW